MAETTSLEIDSKLESKLDSLASEAGCSISELAQSILNTHIDHQEELSKEYADDGQRWQRYLQTGQSVTLDEIRNKLSRLSSQGAK